MTPAKIKRKDPKWVSEVKAEIERLDFKIDQLKELAEQDQMTSEHYEDLDNWKGWRDALVWVLRLREGKAKREDAWG